MQLKSLEDTQDFSKRISKIVTAGDIIFLYGEIGVGKTSFARFFINYLESKNEIKNSDVLSPTFNILYDYDIKDTKILHYDLYRLKNKNELIELNIDENIKNNVTLVEWPKMIINNSKFKNYFLIKLKIISYNKRDIEITHTHIKDFDDDI